MRFEFRIRNRNRGSSSTTSISIHCSSTLLHFTTSRFSLLTVQYSLWNRTFHAGVDIHGLLDSDFSSFSLLSLYFVVLQPRCPIDKLFCRA
ncbi:uncharacterized protein BDV14DRAFT_74464 [Aspergillus stella-maris]|uniref:uncharacterized protein n=1 Tax=Aspergillus stella-maris TaxID=1810926 RepID=UPI003CCD8102